MKVKDLFDVKYGVNLELMTCDIVPHNDVDGINFVGRTAANNGVVARVRKREELEPHPAGVLSCAGGGSVLSTFVQAEPFYSGRDLYILTPKREMTLQEKLYYCMCIKANISRYSYGRQANKTLKDIELPNVAPDWIYDVPIKPIKTSICQKRLPHLKVADWEEFSISELFNVSVSKDKNIFNSSKGNTPYIASSADNNGVTEYVDSESSQKADTLTIARNGSVGATFYQPNDYCASPDDVRILTPKFIMNVYIGLFLKTIIECEKFKYGYGRKLGTARIKSLRIKLPTTSQGLPDWGYMEQYIKFLPYADRI